MDVLDQSGFELRLYRHTISRATGLSVELLDEPSELSSWRDAGLGALAVMLLFTSAAHFSTREPVDEHANRQGTAS